jgi:DNA-binding transcriptional regulator YiaG
MMLMAPKKRHPWGKRLQGLRKAIPDLTQEALAERLEMPVATLRKWEQGQGAPPSYIRTLLESYLKSLR